MAGSEPRRTIALEAHEIVCEREAKYGPMTKSWPEIAQLAELLASPSDTAAERAVLMLVATKLIRRKYSPDNRDHGRDAAGYLVILDELKRAAERGEPLPKVGVDFDLALDALQRVEGVLVTGAPITVVDPWVVAQTSKEAA